MNHYLDIRIQPDPEFSTQLLMNALYSKLHRALVQLESKRIGVSFPGHSQKPKGLGDTLRLHSEKDHLVTLMAESWLKGMVDHVNVGDIALVPADAKNRVVRRVQKKTNVERVRRRYARRHDVPMEQARATIPESAEQTVSLPFAMLTSQSSGEKFPLFIQHAPVQEEAVEGEFNTYGLSKGGTVPWF